MRSHQRWRFATRLDVDLRLRGWGRYCNRDLYQSVFIISLISLYQSLSVYQVIFMFSKIGIRIFSDSSEWKNPGLNWEIWLGIKYICIISKLTSLPVLCPSLLAKAIGRQMGSVDGESARWLRWSRLPLRKKKKAGIGLSSNFVDCQSRSKLVLLKALTSQHRAAFPLLCRPHLSADSSGCAEWARVCKKLSFIFWQTRPVHFSSVLCRVLKNTFF